MVKYLHGLNQTSSIMEGLVLIIALIINLVLLVMFFVMYSNVTDISKKQKTICKIRVKPKAVVKRNTW